MRRRLVRKLLHTVFQVPSFLCLFLLSPRILSLSVKLKPVAILSISQFTERGKQWSPRQESFFFFYHFFYCCSSTVISIFPPFYPTPHKKIKLNESCTHLIWGAVNHMATWSYKESWEIISLMDQLYSQWRMGSKFQRATILFHICSAPLFIFIYFYLGNHWMMAMRYGAH